MTVSLPERLQQLTSRMLRKRLFVVTMTADAGPDMLAMSLSPTPTSARILCCSSEAGFQPSVQASPLR
jgi:hypothetical protein